jgi:hypothetical protein
MAQKETVASLIGGGDYVIYKFKSAEINAG